jgi:hypothetical protein
MSQIFALIGIGLTTGILSGLLGVGGGVILIPALVGIFHLTIHKAIGTSLAVIVVTAICGSYFHYREGNIDLLRGLYIAIASIIGSKAGVYLSTILSPLVLKRVFGIFILFIGIKMIVGK